MIFLFSKKVSELYNYSCGRSGYRSSDDVHDKVRFMFASKFSKRLIFTPLLLSLFSTGFGVYGQNLSSANAKKKKAKVESCDGAADIVPAKPMSFVRKRRPATKEQPAESKSDKSK